MTSYGCPFCSRTFSTKSARTQHVNHCSSDTFSSEEESELITNINDMSLDREDLNREVKN